MQTATEWSSTYCLISKPGGHEYQTQARVVHPRKYASRSSQAASWMSFRLFRQLHVGSLFLLSFMASITTSAHPNAEHHRLNFSWTDPRTNIAESRMCTDMATLSAKRDIATPPMVKGKLVLPAAAQASPSPRQLLKIHDLLVVAYIAYGGISRDAHLALSIDSLRRNGQWNGKIFALVSVNSTNCVPSTATAIEIANPSKVERVSSWAKHFKQLVFRLLPLSASQKYVFYLDIDIYIGAPVGPFFLRAICDLLASNATIGLFREATGFNGLDDPRTVVMPLRSAGRTRHSKSAHVPKVKLYHGGMFLGVRDRSERCLLAWSKWHGASSRDQPTLTRAVLSGACVVSVLPQEHYGQPHPTTAGVYFTFNHFTRSGRLKGRANVTEEQIVRAGIDLLGMGPDKAKDWWRQRSSLC